MDALNVVFEALNQELAADGSKDSLCALTIYPGDGVPIDYAGIESDDCDGGMAWVRLVSVNPTKSFPSADVNTTDCTYTLAYRLEISIMRRAPLDPETFGQDTDLPTDADHYEATVRQMADMHLMHRAIQRANGDIDDLVPGDYTPIGPTGGALGGTWGLTVGEPD